MEVFSYLLEEVEKGKPFKINFKTKTMRVGNKTLIKDGVCKYEMKLEKHDDFLSHAYELYKVYKWSYPNKKECNKKHYFYAEKKMKWEEMVVSEPREIARAKLEGYILQEILSGKTWNEVITDNEEKYKFFYQRGDFVIFKEWFNE